MLELLDFFGFKLIIMEEGGGKLIISKCFWYIRVYQILFYYEVSVIIFI